MAISPLKKKILVRLLPFEDEVKSGLKIVYQKEDYERKAIKCEVLSVGEKCGVILPGDVVVIRGYAGTYAGGGETSYRDETSSVQSDRVHRIIDYEDIEAVVEARVLVAV